MSMTRQRKYIFYKFKKNGAWVKFYYLDIGVKKKRFKDDVLWLDWLTEERKKISIGMRPDEALLVAEMLIEGVRRSTEAYMTSKPIKGYKINKEKESRDS